MIGTSGERNGEFDDGDFGPLGMAGYVDSLGNHPKTPPDHSYITAASRPLATLEKVEVLTEPTSHNVDDGNGLAHHLISQNTPALNLATPPHDPGICKDAEPRDPALSRCGGRI
ncbi:hypothetical protein FGG08_004137 [Glutinoglossum americanum]|uniref:Uncharacterized protein n=1 Tax=Glutinoglossum americanum TaxID=1670608 RepID=A0A9P8L2S6_9PEZI|nr:hypothetical protein FGG08_004137 [Glutinoglossum americanum]